MGVFQIIENGMPRKARIAAFGARQHIIAHGNERRKIFDDDYDFDWPANQSPSRIF
jgi:hypothetical protein